ncbi:MAG: hypothetical protein JNM63_19375, partial [Spirochaetia bacterium]|nr:hypothetical protein [Spirochaetia bacterium]
GILGIPYIQMDQDFWRPNWTQPNDETFFADLRKVLSGERWVLDRNYNRTTPIKWENIDLVVWWMIKAHRKMRLRYCEVMLDPKWKRFNFVRLRNPREVEAFLERIQSEAGVSFQPLGTHEKS